MKKLLLLLLFTFLLSSDKDYYPNFKQTGVGLGFLKTQIVIDYMSLIPKEVSWFGHLGIGIRTPPDDQLYDRSVKFAEQTLSDKKTGELDNYSSFLAGATYYALPRLAFFGGGGDAVEDCAGVCGGSEEVDCEGECGGDKELDECDVCGGDGKQTTYVEECVYQEVCNWTLKPSGNKYCSTSSCRNAGHPCYSSSDCQYEWTGLVHGCTANSQCKVEYTNQYICSYQDVCEDVAVTSCP